MAAHVGSNAPRTAFIPIAIPIAPNPVPIQLEKVRSLAIDVRSSAMLVRVQDGFLFAIHINLADGLPCASASPRTAVPKGLSLRHISEPTSPY